MTVTHVHADNLAYIHTTLYRGESFRREFSRLSEVRSVIPQHVNVMVLTATATVSSRNEIIRSLDMQKPMVVSVPPIKENIFYCVLGKSTINVSLGPLCDRLSSRKTSMGRTIIFCRTYDEVTAIYYFFKQRLGVHFTEPPGAPDCIPQFRLVDMYTHCTHQTVKDQVLKLSRHHLHCVLSSQRSRSKWESIAQM